MSEFSALMKNTVVPLLLGFMGEEAVLTDANQHMTACRVLMETSVMAVGQYGEAMEKRTTLLFDSSLGAVVGNTMTMGGVVWTLIQKVEDDGYFVKFDVH